MAIKRVTSDIKFTGGALLASTASLLLSLQGCSVVDRYRDPEPAFNLASQALYLQSGLGGVRGIVNAGENGTPRTCVGHQVYLVPDTPFFQYKVRRVAAGDEISDVGLEDDRFDHLVRHVPCPANGGYSFEGLPDAPWIVLTTLSAPKGTAGAPLSAHVTTHSGLTETVNLDQGSALKK